ncbi:hypothetical protein HAX54_040579 [Datura stramonium]|uniref:Uncharacterized protein n=1 Tax=Datura stramonium TaxID=4076 RepID=A0ABS8VMV4_DATST|nr:hypothetical protein [Datura stramonium]
MRAVTASVERLESAETGRNCLKRLAASTEKEQIAKKGRKSSKLIGTAPDMNLVVGTGVYQVGMSRRTRTNILEAHVQVLSLLKKEYTPEDRQDLVKMVSMQDLEAKLDSLL